MFIYFFNNDHRFMENEHDSQELTEDVTTRSMFHDVKTLTRNGKPKELFFSSDLCALVEHTKNYLAIEDNEVVHLKVRCRVFHLI